MARHKRLIRVNNSRLVRGAIRLQKQETLRRGSHSMAGAKGYVAKGVVCVAPYKENTTPAK